jgi:hypothetical protein
MTNGTGVATSRKYPAITIRVEILGKLNEAYQDALNHDDMPALIQIAARYAEAGCPRRANEIMTAAGKIKWVGGE